MTSRIQPKASWEKEFDVNFGIFSTNVNKNPLTSKVLKSFIHQAIEEAVEAERKRIEEVVKGLELDEQFVGPLFNAGHSAALGKVLSLIHMKLSNK